MTQAAFGSDGRARIVAGCPAIVALQLLEADGTTPQDLTGRRFVYSVWRPGSGAVVGDFPAAGEDAVVEDGRTVLKLGPTGDDTDGWATGPMRRADLAWAIYELTGEGQVIWWPADGRPGRYQVTGARDPNAAFPTGPGPNLDGPYAVISLAGQAGGAAVLGVTAQGAPGVSAVQVEIGLGNLPEGATDQDYHDAFVQPALDAADAATSAAASATSAAASATSAASAANTAANAANASKTAADTAAASATSAAASATSAASSATSAASAATTAAGSANSAASSATTAASSANTAATAANSAKTAADTATTAANTATSNANAATSSANTAAGSATSAASSATSAAASANSAAGSANTAATAANSAAAAATAAAATALDLTPIDISTSTYTAQASDNGKVLSCSNAGGCTITLPNSLAVGWNAIVCQAAAGQVTLSPASGATLRNASGLTKTRAQWSELGLRVRANSDGSHAEYVASGDMA